MAGPTQQSTNTVIIPPGEGRRTYSSAALAWSVENLEVTTDGALKSVVGPSIYVSKKRRLALLLGTKTRIFLLRT